MTICFFGDFNKEYSRNRILLRGLKENKIEVIMCNVEGKRGSIVKYFKLVKKYLRIKNKHDIVISGYSDDRWIPVIANIICRKPVIWDAFYSLYDVWVFDKKVVSEGSLKAFYTWLKDWLSCKMSDAVLLDTNEHIQYFVKTYRISKSKFKRVLIGADEKVFYPKNVKANNEKFLVSFHGKFIPVQGVLYIVRAAKLLGGYRNIAFNFIGKGQQFDEAVKLSKELNLTNVNFLGFIAYEKLIDYLSSSDVILGNFGDTDKATRVIANKSYESMALARAQISADVPAMREVYKNRENILFCKRANPEDLAQKILELVNNHELKDKIAKNAYKTFLQIGTPKIIVSKLLKEINNLVK